jgi:DNA-binding transcriptional ArsR family regulator
MRILPSTRDFSIDQRGKPRVVGVDDENMNVVLDALSSDTARTILSEIYSAAATPSDLRNRTDLSLQTISYHLSNLLDANLIQIVGTEYSEKGREMNVYAPADEPCVVFVGTQERKSGLLDLFKRVFGAGILLLGATTYLFFHTVRPAAPPGSGASTGGILEYGFFGFLLGGLFILALVVLWGVWTRYR